jgi:hypothetical protein
LPKELGAGLAPAPSSKPKSLQSLCGHTILSGPDNIFVVENIGVNSFVAGDCLTGAVSPAGLTRTASAHTLWTEKLRVAFKVALRSRLRLWHTECPANHLQHIRRPSLMISA